MKTFSLCCVATTLLLASSSPAADVSLRFEPALAIPLSSPQRDFFGFGATISGTLQVSVLSWFDVEARAGYLALTRGASSPLSLGGSSIDLGLGVRLHAPFANASWVPFVEGAGAYVLTGTLSRPGVRGAIGALFPLLRGSLWLGPHVAYQHVFALNAEPTFPTRDASLLVVGVTGEFPLGARAADRDGDGVLDEVDACPDVAAPGRADGCPDDDPDQDGLRGAADQCPAQAEDRDGFRDDDGCPEADNDGDGLLDQGDECPDLPGSKATRGCPDGDSDGVADLNDKCPKVAGLPANGGCPKYKAIVVTETNIELSQKIFFAFGLTTILPRSYPLLDEVVQALTDRRTMCVRIEGHTDAVGTLDKNMALSNGRASAVRDYLATHGVPSANLEATGYGPTLPLASNGNDEGRERNRRVEFVIIPCPAGQR